MNQLYKHSKKRRHVSSKINVIDVHMSTPLHKVGPRARVRLEGQTPLAQTPESPIWGANRKV